MQLSLNAMESIYLKISVVYSIILEINNPVQNTTHVYYFNIVNARFTAKFLIAVSSLRVHESRMLTDKYLLT
jgi:hypothetical protein